MSALMARLVARWQRRCDHADSVLAEKIGGDWRIGWVYWCERCGAVSMGKSQAEALGGMARPSARAASGVPEGNDK